NLIDETTQYDQDVNVLVKTHTFSTKEQKESVTNLIKAIETGSLSSAPSVQKTQKQTIALLSAEGRARLQRIYSECEKLVDISRSKLEDAQAQVQDTVVKTGRIALAAGAAVVGATVLVAVFLGLSLLNPLQNLLKGVKKVTEGEFNLELSVEGND